MRTTAAVLALAFTANALVAPSAPTNKAFPSAPTQAMTDEERELAKAGLSVGIPALIANRFLLGRVDRLLIELEEASLAALDALAAPDVGVGVAKAADEGEDAT